jgi:hypothetical protein
VVVVGGVGALHQHLHVAAAAAVVLLLAAAAAAASAGLRHRIGVDRESRPRAGGREGEAKRIARGGVQRVATTE